MFAVLEFRTAQPPNAWTLAGAGTDVDQSRHTDRQAAQLLHCTDILMEKMPVFFLDKWMALGSGTLGTMAGLAAEWTGNKTKHKIQSGLPVSINGVGSACRFVTLICAWPYRAPRGMATASVLRLQTTNGRGKGFGSCRDPAVGQGSPCCLLPW